MVSDALIGTGQRPATTSPTAYANCERSVSACPECGPIARIVGDPGGGSWVAFVREKFENQSVVLEHCIFL